MQWEWPWRIQIEMRWFSTTQPNPNPQNTKMFTEYLGHLLLNFNDVICIKCLGLWLVPSLKTKRKFLMCTHYPTFFYKKNTISQIFVKTKCKRSKGSIQIVGYYAWSWPYLFERRKKILMLLYSMAQEDSQKCPISFACNLSIEAAVASQRGRTKTSKTGSGCPPCRCRAPSSTCSSSWPGSTCSLLGEVHIHSHDRLAPAVLQIHRIWSSQIHPLFENTIFAAAKALSSDARTEEQKVDDLWFVSTRVKLFKYILEGRLQKLNTCLSVEPGPIRLVCKTTTEFKRT